MTKQAIVIFGSTGSIGQQTLDVVARHADLLTVYALSAQRDVNQLYQQCLQFHPKYAVLTDEQAAERLAAQLKQTDCMTQVLAGRDCLQRLAADAAVDTVVAAIVGAAGLSSSYAAVQAGKRVLLANKEVLVMAGRLFVKAARESGATLIPIDSEHNAVLQCLPPGFRPLIDQTAEIESIVLTASGGPFLKTPLSEFSSITPQQAVAHPNWSMGAKISVDSATMMNKGLEVIEAHWLFNLPLSQIEVLVHPQSLLHAAVKYQDGAMLAQLACPDMRILIASAFTWPKRLASGVDSVSLTDIAQLDFMPLDEQRFPCFELALTALERGAAATIALNAANEIAVAAFLAGDMEFLGIAAFVDGVLANLKDSPVNSLSDVIELDQSIRKRSGVTKNISI